MGGRITNVQTSEGNKNVTEILQKQRPDGRCRNRTDLRIQQSRGAFIEMRAREARPSMNVLQPNNFSAVFGGGKTNQKATKLLFIPH